MRRSIRSQVRKLVGSNSARAERLDDGLFGPGAAAWKVHGDFTTMMIGGISSLLLQMLHPGALAGVWDHSSFRTDMAGRLRGTAQFMSGTTFGDTARASQLIERVRAIHDKVHGTLPDGRPYSANDPDLLAFVHVAGASSFLRSYIRYRDPQFSLADQDRYFAETSEIARRLGAISVPENLRDVNAFLQDVRPQLRVDHRTREVARALLYQPAPSLALAPFQRLVMDAGVDLLPEWAADMHGLHVPMIRRPAVRAGSAGVARVLRWALSVKG